jgi:hypothetical protein
MSEFDTGMVDALALAEEKENVQDEAFRAERKVRMEAQA